MKVERYPYACINIDPGLATGMSLLRVDEESRKPILMATATIPYRAIDIYDQVSSWYYMARVGHGFAADVVMEKFVARPGRPIETTALKVMGVVETWWDKEGHKQDSHYVEHVPVQGKFMVTDDVLRAADVHVKGHANRHINDATRHGIGHLLAQKHRGTAIACFGEPT